VPLSKRGGEKGLAGLSLQTLLFTTIAILLFGIYVGVLMYGENSLTVLLHLQEKKSALHEEARMLKSQNQKLQKEYFELKQLEPKE
jgi:cell division protein FtsB